jgi:autotransporter-associated beta strand protein
MPKVRGRSFTHHLASFAAALLAGTSVRAATEVWTGTTGNWSTDANWLDGTAPVVGGDPTQVLRFTYSGAAATTFVDDLAGTFSLNSLLLDAASPAGVTLSGQTLQFSGAAPQIGLLGFGSFTVANNLVLNPQSGSASITGSGSGGVTLSGTISEAGGARSLVIAAAPASPNVQTISLSGTNTFTGGVVLQSGNLLANSAGALGAGTLTVQGGSLRLASYTYANAISLEHNLVLGTSFAGDSTTISGVISSAVAGTGVDLRQATSFVFLTGVNTYNGSTSVDIGPLASETASAAGRLAFIGSGTALNSPSFSIASGGTLQLDTATAGTINRVSDTASIDLRNGKLLYNSVGGSTPQVETFGPLSSAGYSTVSISASAAGTRLVAGSLNRVERGTYLFAATNLGQAFGTVGSILFTSAPTDLVGGGGSGANTSILPYAIGSNSSTGVGDGLVTYSASAGVRLLTASEYATDLTTAQATNNVSLANTTNDVARTVNAVVLTGSLTGAGSLAITSGTLFTPSTSTVSNDLGFGTREANVFSRSSLTVSGAVSGTAGLTLSGGGTLALTGENSFTGPLTINSGTLSFASAAALGSDTSAIVAAGRGANLTYTGAAPLNLTRALETRSAVVGITNLGGGELTLSGIVSGAGGLILNGVTGAKGRIVLAGANTYTGPTLFAGGTVQFGSDAALGSGGAIDFQGGAGSTALLSGDWTTAREISVSNSATLDTGGFSAVWNAGFSGAGGLTKTGQGELVLNTPSFYANALTILNGAVRLAGAATLASGSYSLKGQGQLVLDNRLAAVAQRVNNNAPVLMVTGGELRLIGNAASAVTATVFLAPTDNSGIVSVESPGAAGTTLHLANGLIGGGTILLRGANLGGAAGTAFTRIVNDKISASSTLLINVIADSSLTGQGESFTVYDAGSDAAGVIGYRPLSAADYTSGNVLQNPANGGTTSLTAHFLAGPGSVAIGNANTVQSLTLEGGADLTLGAGQSLKVTGNGLLARAGATPTTISGGTLIFLANIYAAGETTISSQIAGTVFRKVGPGLLSFDGTLGDQVTVTLDGPVRAGANNPFATSVVNLGSTGKLTFAPTDAVAVGGLTGAGEVNFGASALTIGNNRTDMAFSGRLIGTGDIVITDGGNSAARRAILTGDNSGLANRVILNSGRLELFAASSLGHATLVVNGGSVRAFGSSVPSHIDSAIELHTDLTVLGSSIAFSFGPTTTISGAHDVLVRGTGGLTIQGPLSLEGNLRSTYGPDDEFVTVPGTMTMSGAQGALVQAAGVQLKAGSSLILNDGTAFTGGVGGRLGDSIPVQLSAATLSLVANVSGFAETVGPISGSGYSVLSIGPAISLPTTLQASSLTRIDRGTFLLSVTNNGTLGGPGTSSGGKIKLTTAPTLVGGGGTGPATSIVPWAFTLNGSLGPVTYDANGFRPLTSSEMASSLAVAGSTDNAQQSSAVANNVTRTVNSLTLTGSGSNITGTGTLNLASGVLSLQSGGAPTISNQINFGAAEGQLFVNGATTINGVVSGGGGLTKSGLSTLTLAGHNTFTGPLTVNSGTLAFSAADNLGADASTITLTGSNTVLQSSATGVLTLARPLRLGDGLPALTTAGTLVVSGQVSGPGGLQITGGTVQLAAGNTYAGPTVVSNTVVIADDSSLGTGTGLFLNNGSTVRLEGDWTSSRRVEFRAFGGTINTNGHDAVLNGPIQRSGTAAFLMKTGAGTLTFAGDATGLNGTLTLKQGELRLAGAGVLGVPSFSFGAQTALVLDNTTTALDARLAIFTIVALTGAQEMRLLGNASVNVLSKTGAFSSAGAGANTLTLTAPGTASTIFQPSSLSSTGVLIVRGDALGGGPAGPFTRLIATTAPAGFAALASSTSAAAGTLALAIYDTNTDAAGVIGVRPLAAADFTTGAEIRNPLNGGTTATNANFQVTGATATGGLVNSVGTLTFTGSSSVSMAAGQTLSLLTPGVLVEAGGSATITGGSLAFTAGSGFFHTEGDLTVQSSVTSPIVNKSGPGQLVFGAATPYNGTFNLTAGSVRAGSANALSGAVMAMTPGTALDFASKAGGLASLKGSGTVILGSSLLQLAADSSFTGDISGTGGLTALGNFEPFTAVSYTGPTTAGKSFFLRGAGTATGSSSFNVLAGGLLQLDNSTQVLTRIGAVPVTVNGGTFELIGNTLAPVTVNVGSLTGGGVTTVKVDATSGRLPVALNFTALARQDHGTFLFSAGASPAILGGGQSTLTFGSGLSAALVGANTRATNLPILPFAVATTTTSGIASLVTYDAVTGIRPLLTAEYSSTFSNGDNVLINGSLTSNTNDTINALVTTSGTISGNGTLSITSGTILARSTGVVSRNLDFGAGEAIILVDGGLSVNGVISGSGGLTKSGAGQLTLSQTNTFTGPLTINQGTLSVASLDGLGADPSEIVMNGATLNASSLSTPVLTRPVRLSGGANVISGNLVLNGPISGAGGLSLPGTVTLGGQNSYTGTTSILGQTTIGSNAAFGLSSKVLLTGGTLRLGESVHLSQPVEASGIIDTNGFDLTLDGLLSSNGQLALQKAGAGLLTIANPAAYVGLLSVAAGEVRMNGQAPASGSVTVNAGATFSGDVQTTRAYSIAGTLAPGNGGVGNMGSGSLSMQNNSTLALELGPTASDQMQVTGSVTLTGTVNLTLSLAFGRTDVIDQFTIILNDGTDAVSLAGGGRLTYAGDPLDEGESFTVDGQKFVMSYAGGDGNDVVLYATPEPGNLALLATGVLALGAARRRLKLL